MIVNGKDCSEVLIQLAAVRSALNGICELIIRDHIQHCLVSALERGDQASVEALNRAIRSLLRN